MACKHILPPALGLACARCGTPKLGPTNAEPDWSPYEVGCLAWHCIPCWGDCLRESGDLLFFTNLIHDVARLRSGSALARDVMLDGSGWSWPDHYQAVAEVGILDVKRFWHGQVLWHVNKGESLARADEQALESIRWALMNLPWWKRLAWRWLVGIEV